MLWKPDWPQLGDKVREIVSGYEGIVTGCATYLWGCEMVVVGRADKDGKPEADWFDVGRIEIVERAALASTRQDVTGADLPPPIR